MKEMNYVYMSTCMTALCRHVNKNKSQGVFDEPCGPIPSPAQKEEGGEGYLMVGGVFFRRGGRDLLWKGVGDSQPRPSGGHARSSSCRRLCVLRLPHESQLCDDELCCHKWCDELCSAAVCAVQLCDDELCCHKWCDELCCAAV